MIPMSLARIAEVVGGEVRDADPALMVLGPAFLDSRDPVPAGLFAAFIGERADGHRYADSAVAGGAAAVLASRSTGVPTVVVEDVRSALQRLARHVLAELRAHAGALMVVALTGSQGKTTTKDLLARVLGDQAPTVATHGSFNNELGLPLTVLRAEQQTRFLVLEMGARGIGHLTELCAIAPPDVSVVLNVGRAHLGEFGSQQAIARAKGELVEALGVHGTAILNADDPLVDAMATRTSGRVVRFGRASDADVRVDGVVLDDLGRAGFELVVEGRREHVGLQVLGEHQVLNAAAVAAVATAVGLSLDDIAASLSSVSSLSAWRMELHERADGLVVINDAYNANPDSMRAALETLATLGARSGRRTVAVLGAMLELGAASAAEHATVGQTLDRLGIAEALVIGTQAQAIRGRTTRHVDSVEQASAWLRDNVQRTDLVLVKASRGIRLERVADALLTEEW